MVGCRARPQIYDKLHEAAKKKLRKEEKELEESRTKTTKDLAAFRKQLDKSKREENAEELAKVEAQMEELQTTLCAEMTHGALIEVVEVHLDEGLALLLVGEGELKVGDAPRGPKERAIGAAFGIGPDGGAAAN